MTVGPKAICLISPSLQMGGLERAMSNLANYFQSRGFKVYYVVLYKFEKFYDLNSEIVFYEPEFRYDSASKLIYYFRLLNYIRKTVTSIKPDTVLAFGDYHNALVLFALKGLTYPVYVSDRSSPDKDFGKLFTTFKKWVYPLSQGIIAQTNRAAKQKKSMLGESVRIQVIPNAIRQMEITKTDRQNYILSVGRHYSVKGIDRLIDAFSMVKSNWKLVLAGGGGPESENLKAQVEKLGIKERVVFLGKIKAIDKLYSEAGMFVLPSRSEGFPNALCEAMAAGLACISFDIIAGPSEIIQNGKNGILVEDGNVSKLSQQIQLLIDDSTYRAQLGDNAKDIREKLSPKKTGDKYLKFILSHI